MKIFFTLILTGMSLYLVRGQGASLSVQTGHSVEILDIQFSPDGKLLSSRDANNVIKIWFVPTGNEMASFRYHHTIKQLKFNHSGNQLVILDEQNKLSFLDIGSMSVVREESINFSAKNMDVVGESIIFSGDKIHVLAEQEQFDGILNGYEAFTIHYSDTDKKFVSVNLSGFFTEHAFTNTNYKIHIPKNPDQHPMGFSVDNKYFAIGSFAKVIIYNLKDKSKYFTFNSNYADEYFTSVAFSTVNNIVVAANSDGLVYVADLNQKRIIRRLKDHITGVNSVVFNKDETIFATASKDRSIILWDAKTLSPLKKLSTRSFQINTVTVAKSQPLIAFGDEYGYVKLIDFDDISFQVYHARYHKNGIADISFIDGDKKLIVGGKDNRISVLKVNQSLELEKQVVFSKGTNISKIGNKSLNLMGYYTESLSQVEQINCSSDGSVVLVNGKYSNGENVKSLVEMFTIPKLDKIVKISTNQMDKSSIDKKIVFENITNGWKISAGVNEGKYMDFDDKSINMKNIKFLEEGIMFTDTNGKLYIKPDDKELNLSAFYKKWESFSKNLDYDKNYNCLAVSIENSIYIIDEFGNTTNLDGHQDNITSLQFFDNGKLLISSSKDATLKIWDTKTKKLKVTIIPIDFDKVVMISPDNYYLAPKGALDGVGFKQGIDFFPVQQFDLVYNRPDIVLSNLGFSDQRTISMYKKAYDKRLKKMNFSEENLLLTDLHLPVVEVLNESIPLQTDKKTFSLSIGATDSKFPLDRLLIKINNVPVSGTGGIVLDSGINRLNKSFDIELSPGRNIISVSVINNKGTESLAETFEINCIAPFDSPVLYVYTLGVSDFQQSNYNLNYAAKDAVDVASLLEQSKVFTTKRVKKIINEDVSISILPDLRKDLLETNVNDVVLFFVASHGLLDQNLDYYIATHDIDFLDPARKALSYEALEGILDGIPARNKILFIDACHSGEVDKDEIKIEQSENSSQGEVIFRALPGSKVVNVGLDNSFELMKTVFSDLRKNSGTVVISSAGGAEYAIEGDKWKNGVFTYSLLKGLNNKEADLNKDGQIAISESLVSGKN